MKYADRINRIPPYLFAEIDKTITSKRKSGVDVISLGIGDPDIPTPKEIVESLSLASQKTVNHRYPSYEGMIEFRDACAVWMKKRFNVELNPESEVLTLIGSKEGIAHMPLAFVNPSDVVLYSNPGYPVYEVGTILADGVPVPIPLESENDFKPDLSAIDLKTARKARIMHLNYPNNPTAATVETEFFSEVVSFAKEHDIIVCHDAAYSEVSFDGYKAPSFLEVDGALDVGIEFHSLSKTFNMTGWRIGFAVGNPEVIAGLGKVKQNVDSGVFQGIQEAAITALKLPATIIEKNNRIIQARRNLMVDGLSKLGWKVPKPKATFYLWIPVPDGSPSIDFAKKVLDETGVVVTPGVGFGEYGEGYIRIALTQSEQRLNEALDRFEKLK
ncbi:MAG: LL-diaminopimelate aminotransferase [Methanobacteriota archaeon]